ncbi:MAG TPA: ABC transporter transmembrane domain-containing protein [Bryobacteraceae bacterium]|jgi:ATP-binding cassette subfamily B protein|nr:ABC transporter transmembrane domain-containing protein [Bryobacteraceae bacterium]
MTIPGVLLALYRYVRPFRWRLVPVFLACLLEMGLTAQLPLSIKYLIDRALVNKDGRALVVILTALAASAVLVSAAGLGRDHLYARIVARSIAALRARMYDRLQRVSLEFYSRRESSDILARFSNDLNSIDLALLAAVGWGLQPVLDIILSIALVFAFEWRLALVGTLLCPICALGPRLLARRGVEAAAEKRARDVAVLSIVQETISAPALIQTFSLRDRFMGTFRRSNDRLLQSSIRLGFLTALMDKSSTLGALLLQVIVMAVGGWMAFHDRISIGTFASFQALFVTLSQSVSYLASYSPTLVGATGAVERMEGMLAEQARIPERQNAQRLAPPETIEFRDVTFGYTAAQNALDHVTFSLGRGASVAFVGASGSGKSTVLNLLLRFYDPSQGTILIDGTDLRDAAVDSLRQQTAVVFQETFLFNMSIRENVRLGRPDATDAEIESAARDAEIHDFILSLPEGYDTLAGERGSRFSGGQRQRLAIARAVLRHPAILILDEATSSLDPATEAAVNATFARIASGRTVISITHRLSSVIHADWIYVMHQGQIAEQGRHDELVASGGRYSSMWRRQSGLRFSEDEAGVDAKWLGEMPLFQNVDPSTLEELATLFATEQIPEERDIICEGDPGDRFYIIVRGKAEVLKASKRAAVLQDGDYFGEIALLSNQPRNATVRSLTPCVCLILQRDHFRAMLDRSAPLRERMEQVKKLRE